ncbi:MAG: hypothetical protein U0990_00225 [Candidatus Nanopelagicales bacterium]|nr:hypothetical protein [Candidatus Nanopelagicales bacterium]MDZ4248500.1 hypothetical protein [Candidatus Nanopelagicales bacterium]
MNTKTRRRPILGFFSGLVFAIGISLLLFVYGVLPMTVVWLGFVALAGAVIGVVLAYIAPAREPADGASTESA